jgi:parallel beta-helix repeat protein
LAYAEGEGKMKWRVEIMLTLLLLSTLTLAFDVRRACAQTTLAGTVNGCRVDNFTDPAEIHFGAIIGITGLQQYDSLVFSDPCNYFYTKTIADIDGYTSSELESKVKSALTSMPMIGHMPQTSQSCWLVYDRYMINAYDWSQQWNVETAKWNKTQATQEATSCYHNAGHALLGLDLDGGWQPSNRYYDENGETLDIMNKLGSSSDALAIWNYLNSALWNGQIYAYKPGGGFECEVGPFAMLIGYYHAINPNIPYFDRMNLDLYDKMLINGWKSPAWSSSPGVMQHASTNPEERLSNTLAGFTALQTYYCTGSQDYKQAFQSLLTDSPKAWEGLVSSPLYSSGKFSWRNNETISDTATAAGMMLLFLEGIIPDTGCLAIPLNEWTYQDLATMLPYTQFRFDYSSRRIRIPVLAGSIKFQFGTSVANAKFSLNGVYEVQFSSDWNSVLGANMISPLSDQFYYLQPTGTPPPPSETTIYVRADGSIDPPTAPIQQNGDVCTLTGNITSNADGIIVERNNVTIDGAGYTILGSGIGNGFTLHGTDCVTIKDAKVTNFFEGIDLDRSSGNSISGNTITNNEFGIYFDYSCNNNSVSENNIANNMDGILLGSSNNNNGLSGNNITNNREGVILGSSDNNSVNGNNIASNGGGIWLDYSSNNNTIYHNNFMNNAGQAYSAGSTNVWDDGYPSGGNYWSDYLGNDTCGGPYQNQTGSDGIGDTPYIINVLNADHYPLMKPYPWAAHDVGVTSVTASKNIVGQGYDVSISVMMFNYGVDTETFNVAAYANTTIIGSQYITLPSGNFTIVRFIWNTTGSGKGNHIISAYAEPLQGEIDTADNILTDGIVKVTIVGDVNGDGKVNLVDVFAVALAFGSYPGHPKWNPNCDINNDGKINLLDYFITAVNYGKTYPNSPPS